MAIRRALARSLAAALMLCVGCRRAEPVDSTPADKRPNIVLITVESLRADHVGCYGYQRPTTPAIDALAAKATRYEQAHAVTSWTLSSHASIFTGLYPSAHRVIDPTDRLADSYPTVAEVLAEGGYQTAGVIGGPYLRKAFNLNQGFAYYDESVAAENDAAAHKDVTNPRMSAALERFLRHERDPKRPFFLFAYYWDVHHDYIPPAPFDAQFVPPSAAPIDDVQFSPITKLGRDISPAQLEFLVAQYDGEIRCTDDYLGRLWALLRELKLWDNTLIILTADHGEQFFDHSYLGHKHDLYTESVHVPLIVKRPHQSAPQRNASPVSHVDLFPSILEIADLSSASPTSGVSLFGDRDDANRALFFELRCSWSITEKATGKTLRDESEWVALRRGKYRLLHVRDTGFWQLYDVLTDPGERNPLGPAFEQQAVELRTQMEQWTAAMESLSRNWQVGPQAQLSPKELERLRSLGYIE